jgi:hypothetical protein
MKNLEEKKLLLKMMRAFGQDDKELAESIRREEELSKTLFKEEPKIVDYEKGTTFLNRKPIIEEQLIVEADPIPPAPAFTPPTTNTVLDVVNVLKTANANTNIYRDKEIEGIRRTIGEMMQKISTMSWGGGGTGIVRLFDADDFDRSSAQNGRFMKFQDGWFVLDEINPYEIVHNTTLVTTNTYVVNDTDYYIGINHAGPVTIVIPSAPSSGREIVIKDESGNCSNNPITVSGPVDNDNSGFILEIDNGAIHMLFRGNFWRII